MSAGAKVKRMYKTPEEVREAVRRAVRFGESFPLPKAERLTAQNVSALQATGGGRINRIDVRQFIAGKEIQTHASQAMEQSRSLRAQPGRQDLLD